MTDDTLGPPAEGAEEADQVSDGLISGSTDRALMPALYDELRKLARLRLARETSTHARRPTSLVHEVYVRLAGDKRAVWDRPGHYFSAAAEAMRRILVEEARRRMTLKRGGNTRTFSMGSGDVEIEIERPLEEVLYVDEALDMFAELHPKKAELVKLRYFAGLSHQEAARALGISRATADRYWLFARAWLRDRLEEDDDASWRRKPK